MKALKRILAGTLSAVMVLGTTGGAFAAGGEVTIGIYSTTDMHGKCYDVNPITGKEVKDSLLKVATAMAQEREEQDYTLLLDNGDIIQGTPIISYNITMEGGEQNPMALCLRYCGYDAFTLGNHEFNFSTEVQQNFYDLLADDSGTLPGQPVAALCSNYIDKETQETRMTPYIVRSYQVGGKEFRVGILGFENVNVPNWDPAFHYDGADFVHAENTQRTLAYEWTNYWQKVLREEEGCDFVIVMAHSGEGGDAVGAGDQGAVGEVSQTFSAENQVYHMVANTTGIDLVVAGHNHVPGVSTCKNAEGKEVPVVNGGTSTLTKTVLTVKSDGSFTVGQSEALKLADYDNDAGLKELMTPYYDRTVPFVSQQIGTLSGDWDDETDLFHVQSDTMDLVHEAQLWATGADLSIASPVANKGFCIGQLLEGETGPISLKDCYSFYKYDNNTLFMVEMTGLQLKNWLEDCVKDYAVDETGAITGGGFGTDQLYGISYDVYLADPEGQRVHNMTYQGKPVTAEQTFKVAVNSYRLSANAAGDEYGWYAVTGITVGDEAVLWDGSVSEEFGSIGGSVTLIIAEYIKSLTAAGQDITPPAARSYWTLNAGTSAEALASVTRLDFIHALYEAAGSPTDLGSNTCGFFSDYDDPSDLALAWAVQGGIVLGDGTGRLLPQDAITREQALVMLLRYDIRLKQGPVGAWAVRVPYADAANASSWAAEALMWNVIKGYLSADAMGDLSPLSPLTASALWSITDKLTGK